MIEASQKSPWRRPWKCFRPGWCGCPRSPKRKLFGSAARSSLHRLDPGRPRSLGSTSQRARAHKIAARQHFIMVLARFWRRGQRRHYKFHQNLASSPPSGVFDFLDVLSTSYFFILFHQGGATFYRFTRIGISPQTGFLRLSWCFEYFLFIILFTRGWLLPVHQSSATSPPARCLVCVGGAYVWMYLYPRTGSGPRDHP